MSVEAVEKVLALDSNAESSTFFVDVRTFCNAQGVDLKCYYSVSNLEVSYWCCILSFCDRETERSIGGSLAEYKWYTTRKKSREGICQKLLIILQTLLSPDYVRPAVVPKYHEVIPRELFKYSKNGDLELGLYLEFITLYGGKPLHKTLDSVLELWAADAELKKRCVKHVEQQLKYYLNDPASRVGRLAHFPDDVVWTRIHG